MLFDSIQESIKGPRRLYQYFCVIFSTTISNKRKLHFYRVNRDFTYLIQKEIANKKQIAFPELFRQLFNMYFPKKPIILLPILIEIRPKLIKFQ